MTPDEAIKHARELVAGWECGSKMEDAIVAAYSPELEAFTARADEVQHDIRLIRAVLDARDNRDRFRKDAAAVGELLAMVAAVGVEPTTSSV